MFLLVVYQRLLDVALDTTTTHFIQDALIEQLVLCLFFDILEFGYKFDAVNLQLNLGLGLLALLQVLHVFDGHVDVKVIFVPEVTVEVRNVLVLLHVLNVQVLNYLLSFIPVLRVHGIGRCIHFNKLGY